MEVNKVLIPDWEGGGSKMITLDDRGEGDLERQITLSSSNLSLTLIYQVLEEKEELCSPHLC